MPRFSDIKQSRFLQQTEVDPPVFATIEKFEQINVALQGAEPELRWCIWFKQLDKPMTLNSTNAAILMGIFGLSEDDELNSLVGRNIVLYREPSVVYAGRPVGGIRIRAPKDGYQQPEPEPEPSPKDDEVPF